VTAPSKVVLLVGHGGIPKDFPAELVSELKREEARSAGKPAPTPRFSELDAKIRRWPRSPQNDPYQPGLEAVGRALAQALPDHRVVLAYNEFCEPSLEDAFTQAAEAGAREITVITTMYTRGGIHSETEIPDIIAALRRKHPDVEARYVWPFSLAAVADFLAAEVQRVEAQAPAAP